MITLFNKTEDNPIDVKFWPFPDGERGCKIELEDESLLLEEEHVFLIRVDFRSSDDLIDLLLLNNAIRNMFVLASKIDLVVHIPYFPYARQDRVMSPGESLSLQVAVDLIKSCDPYAVIVHDPHSDVLAGMFKPGQLIVVPQEHLIDFDVSENVPTYLVSPDAGALKKIYKIAKKYNLPVIEASKIRDVSTGNIVGTKVENLGITDKVDLIVVDDIIDGGKTFIELAKELKKVYNINRLVLVASHGIFSKGLDVLEDYDMIYVQNNMSDYDLDAFNNVSEF